MNCIEPIEYALSQGGKRIRPLLVLMSCDLFGGNIDEAMKPSIGVELFHNFTLLHDDIMDQAPLRRGKPAVYKKWNTNVAILSGDTMFVMAYDYISKVRTGYLPQVIDLFNDTARKVCEGQQYDMNFETRTDVSIAEYLMMIRLKTAVLLACSLKLGAILAGAGEEDTENIYLFGENLGWHSSSRMTSWMYSGIRKNSGKRLEEISSPTKRPISISRPSNWQRETPL